MPFPNDPYPNSGDSENGFYVPEAQRYNRLPSFQEFINSHEGEIPVNSLDAIRNLITELPFLRQQALQLAGEEVIWLRRKTSGKRCPFYSDIEDQCRVSKCKQCFDTNFLGGFDPPIVMRVSFTPGKSDIKIEEAGLTIVQRPSGWTTITNPIMSEFDILVTFANERYLIHSAEAIEHQGHKNGQEITLSRIDRGDVLQYIPVPGIMGQKFVDFPAFIRINPIYTDFPAMITIVNPYFKD